MYCKPTARPAMLPSPLPIWPRKPDPLSRARDMDSEKAFMSLAAAFMPKEIIWLMPESPTADLSLSQALAMRWVPASSLSAALSVPSPRELCSACEKRGRKSCATTSPVCSIWENRSCVTPRA